MNVIEELQSFYANFNGEKGVFGYSHLNKPLYFFKVYKSPIPKIICQYSIHAREFITTYLAIEQIKDFIKNGKKGTIYFLPMVNPDGVEICLNKDKTYKANVRGVDLNVNFDAKWGSGEKNVFFKDTQNYVGEFPFSEAETQALRDFTLKLKPNMTLSYHSKGEEIYYEFFQDKKSLIRDKKVARKVAHVTGYKIKSTPNSAGGYKDWCVQKLKIPALTVEVGNDNLSHPIEKEHISTIFKQNKKVLEVITERIKWN